MKGILTVIVTYNRKILLEENLQAVLSQTGDCDILVVDNHSTDGTEAMVQELMAAEANPGKNLYYIDTGANLGGSGGFAFGIKEGVKRGYKYLWIMDDDCIPDKDCLEELCRAKESLKGETGFLASRVYWKDGSQSAMNIPRIDIHRQLTDDIWNEDIQPIRIASFVSVLLSADAVRKVGLPIKEFFIWVDDWEYTERISQSYPCYAVKSSCALHKTKDNIGADIIRADKNKLDRYYYMYRNSVYYYHRQGLRGCLYLTVRNIWHMLRILFKAPDARSKRIGILIKGTMDGIRFRPGIEYVD